MKFKKGDKVYFRALYGKKIYEGYGTVHGIELDGFDVEAEGTGHVFFVEPDTPGEVIEHEHIYNSPLYKALQ